MNGYANGYSAYNGFGSPYSPFYGPGTLGFGLGGFAPFSSVIVIRGNSHGQNRGHQGDGHQGDGHQGGGRPWGARPGGVNPGGMQPGGPRPGGARPGTPSRPMSQMPGGDVGRTSISRATELRAARRSFGSALRLSSRSKATGMNSGETNSPRPRSLTSFGMTIMLVQQRIVQDLYVEVACRADYLVGRTAGSTAPMSLPRINVRS
jgi:hypothetical protein